MNEVIEKGKLAKKAKYEVMNLGTNQKNAAILKIADLLVENTQRILDANQKDIENAVKKGMAQSLIDRLKLNEKRIIDMKDGAYQIATLDDPIGAIDKMWKRPNGLLIGKKRVPLGVIGIIYEARPNVTVDASVLCLKAGNAVILRGGSDAFYSNLVLVEIMQEALTLSGITKDAVLMIEDISRETVVDFMKLNEYIDVLIPRGGAGLIKTVVQNATIPVIETGTGNCHVYVDNDADFDMALKIIINAKTSRVSVCNACESLLVHQDIKDEFLPLAVDALKEKNVEIRGCEKTIAVVPNLALATEEDYYAEFLDYIISIKVVKDVSEAISHINQYGTKHSEAIITNSYKNQKEFLDKVDSAAVYVNASTRFTDGFEFGFGAEIGISTQKLHARGPMGLNELTTIKYIVYGDGQIRE